MFGWLSAEAARASRLNLSTACGSCLENVSETPFGETRDLRREELHGDKPAQARVLGLVDDSHASPAQLFQQTVMEDCAADERRGAACGADCTRLVHSQRSGRNFQCRRLEEAAAPVQLRQQGLHFPLEVPIARAGLFQEGGPLFPFTLQGRVI